MKVITPDHVPVLPPSPMLAEAEKRLMSELGDVSPLNTMEVGEASEAWKKHRVEQGYNDLIHPAFGKPTGPADALLPYTRRARGK